MKIKVLFFILFIISIARSNDSLRTEKLRLNSFGLSLNYLSTKHFSDFSQLNEAPSCCPKYTNANGSGFRLAMIYHDYLTKSIAFAPSIGLIITDGLFKSNEDKDIIIDNKPEKAEIEHSLETGLFFIYLETGIIYKLFNNFKFSTSISVDYLAYADFEQKETLIRPENRGTFENGKRIRNESSGKINELNKFNFFISAGISYELPLNKIRSITLLPGAKISAGLNNLLPGYKWGLINISIGLDLLFHNYEEYSTPIEPRYKI